MAVLDAELRAAGNLLRRVPRRRCATEVDCGVSVGIHDDRGRAAARGRGLPRRGLPQDQAQDRARAGRRARRARSASDSATSRSRSMPTPRTRSRPERLARLDEFDLLLIEQPLRGGGPPSAMPSSRRPSRTPICLDESITSARGAADAIALGACRIVNVKAGRVGGYLEARRVHDVCARARRAGLVRRHARDRARARRERRARRAARLHPARATRRRPDRYYARGHHRAVRAARRAARRPDRPGLGVDADPRGPRAVHDVGRDLPPGGSAAPLAASVASSRNCSSTTRRSSGSSRSRSKSSTRRRIR